MRMRELSERSGVSIPSIKYYIREGLLDPGEATRPNQAEYGEEHLRRLALVRALREVGGLSIATIKEVLAASSGTSVGTVSAIGRAMDALAGDIPGDDHRANELAGRIRERLLAEGWEFREESGALRALTRAMMGGCEAFGMEADPDRLLLYSSLVMEIARREFSDESSTPIEVGEEAIAWAVLGTVMFEPVILAMRRLAHEHLALAQLPQRQRERFLRRGAGGTAAAK